MGTTIFSSMAVDAIGEIFNISLGSSATAVSDMLNRRVEISTPQVKVVASEEFVLGDLDPAVAVKIDYVAGLSGSNIMLLRRSDVCAICDILMYTETKEEDFELNELNVSAVCEVMNQMMGAASTAMSDFLGRTVNISTPEAVEIKTIEEFKENYFPDRNMVLVRFKLEIEDAVESEFVSAISIGLSRELLQGFGIGGEDVGLMSDGRDLALGEESASAPAPEPAPAAAEKSNRPLSQEEIEKLMSGGADATPAPAPAAESNRPLSQEEIEKLMGGGAAAPEPAPAPKPQPAPQPQPQPQAAPQQAPAPQPQMAPPMQQPAPQQAPGAMPPPQGYDAQQQGYPPYPQYPYPPYPYGMPPYGEAAVGKTIRPVSPTMRQLEASPTLTEEQSENLNLIMAVPVDVSVEIGRTKRRVREVLAYTKGSLVVFDRLAGDPVDLYVNGQCIARGDVVVVDDNFGLRITEIVQPFEINELTTP